MPDAAGSNKAACFRLGDGSFEAGRLEEGLALRPDEEVPGVGVVHGVVEPESIMDVDSYIRALEATRDKWEKDEA